MRYLPALVLLAVVVLGCVENRENGKVEVPTLPPVVTYDRAIGACNLTGLTGITLNNYSGKWMWELTFENGTTTVFCRVDGKGKNVSIIKLPVTLHSDPIPLRKIRIDEHAAFEAAIENERVVKWIENHNARIDRISLESSPKVTLWRIYLSAEKSFLMVAVNATSGDLISVRGASFGW